MDCPRSTVCAEHIYIFIIDVVNQGRGGILGISCCQAALVLEIYAIPEIAKLFSLSQKTLLFETI